MVQNIFLAYRSAAVGSRSLDGVRAIAINLVSTSTAAQVKAAAVAKLNASKGGGYDANYFDTVVQLDDVTSGPLNANNRAMYFHDRADPAVLT